MWQNSLAALGLAMALLGASLSAHAAAPVPAVGDTVAIPAVTLLDGRHLPAGYFKDKPVILEYWASWCPFCARQNPYLQKLTLEAQKKGLEILTVSIDRKKSDVEDYIAKHHYTFPVVMETPELISVFGKRKVVPEIFVLLPGGKIAEIIPGEMFEEDVLDLIKYAPAIR